MVGICKPKSLLNVIFGAENVPLLVVIAITPLAPLIPYIAVEDASFKMETVSISLELN
ncbi:hypothetical protein D3C85_970690 [compost metagenome]